MKTIKFIAGAAALLIGTSSAFAMLEGGRWYADVKGAVVEVQKIKVKEDTTTNTKQKAGYGVSVAAGYALDAWRFELEGAYRRAKIKTVKSEGDVIAGKGHFEAFSAMGNVCYDIPVADAFSFYVGAGLGYGRIKMKTDKSSDLSNERLFNGHANMVAYQLLAGVSYLINENWSASLGYRFFSTFGKPKFKSESDGVKIKTKLPFVHSFELGVRYTF